MFARRALRASVVFWFAVTIAGQLVFAFTIASFYGLHAFRGDFRGWNRGTQNGYVAGDGLGNAAVAIHLFSALIVILSGALQLVPRIRARAPALHRWNGRVYVVTAFAVSLAGLLMLWRRGTVGGLVIHLAQSLDALLILATAVLALRTARARDFVAHRRWALRLYLLVSASLFIRALALVALTGLDPDVVLGVISFAQYVVPLAVLELYLRVDERGTDRARSGVAAGLSALTLALAAGLAFATAVTWAPRIRKAFDTRPSIADALSDTLASSGIDRAADRYRELKATRATSYNFDEGELNALGYELLHRKAFAEAIRIFQINVEAYPQSGNTWDSLAEAYMDEGDRANAIANYRRSLALKPENANAVRMLEKLGAP